MKSETVMIGAGGTGGHLLPAVAIANKLKELNICPVIVSTGKSLDKKMTQGIESFQIESASPSINPIKALKFLRKTRNGIKQAKKLLNKFDPKIVLGMGGFPSVPLVYAARKKYPILLHEQNSVAGRANSFLAKFADVVMTAFDETLNLPKNKIEVVGNPLRWKNLPARNSDSYKFFGLDDSKKTVLVMGGSQGARSVNYGVLNLPDSLLSDSQIQWVIVSGRNQFEDIKLKACKKGLSNIFVYDYVESMDILYSITDIAITRGGAMTISELESFGVPAVIVPKKNSIYDHQFKNAMYLKSKRNNIIVVDEDDIDECLSQSIELLKNSEKVLNIESNHITALDSIASVIENLLRS